MDTPNDGHSYSQLASIQRSYSIRKQRSSYRYRVTIPSGALETLGIDNGDELGVWARASQDGYLQLVYETDISNCHIVTSVSKHSSGELTIPSSIGAAANLQDESINWDSYKRDDGSYIIVGTTSHQLKKHTTEGTNHLGRKILQHVEQNVEHNGKNWQQEHFQLYLDKLETEKVGWSDGEFIGIVLVSIDGVLGVKYTRRESQVPEKSRKKVQKTGDNQADRLTYTPNGLVRSLRVLDTPLEFFATNAGSLLTIPSKDYHRQTSHQDD